MKLLKCISGVLVLIAIALTLSGGSAKQEIVRDAYIYGYPLVTFDMVRRQQTNVAYPDGEHAPMGQLIKMRNYPAVDNHCCAAPNADTLYMPQWLSVWQRLASYPEMNSSAASFLSRVISLTRKWV